jgi:hypothetical protein
MSLLFCGLFERKIKIFILSGLSICVEPVYVYH